MKCPLCSVDLVMADRQGIEIDYCPKCRGIWLDRGEIDKIVERSQAAETRAMPAPVPQPVVAPMPAPMPAPGWGAPAYQRKYDDDDRRHQGGHGYQKKRKGFLSEILDFD